MGACRVFQPQRIIALARVFVAREDPEMREIYSRACDSFATEAMHDEHSERIFQSTVR